MGILLQQPRGWPQSGPRLEGGGMCDRVGHSYHTIVLKHDLFHAELSWHSKESTEREVGSLLQYFMTRAGKDVRIKGAG